MAIACDRAFGRFEGRLPVAGFRSIARLGRRETERRRVDVRETLIQVGRERAIQGLGRDAQCGLNGGRAVPAVCERREEPYQPSKPCSRNVFTDETRLGVRDADLARIVDE